MCGICGSLRPGGATKDDEETVGAMMRLLEHRGPDGSGIWSEGGAVLGHRRLAIIDLEGGYQPLLNETSEIGVVFNGEIYNYRELRHQLALAGHVFRTKSDTEVLVHGYEEWGDDFVTRLRGMFAFSLWDGRRRRMLLVRDRLGVKSLYYVRHPSTGRLLFASEIKALFADPETPRALNSARLPEYLAFRSISGEETLFAGVRELAPGTFLVLDGGAPVMHRYWSPEVPPAGDLREAALLERGRELLEDSVRARLVSDVRLGTITSGGLDSSLVSSIAAGLTDDPIDTFCVGFQDPAYDERPFARAVASRIGSRHHDIVVTPEEIDRELDHLTWAHDEPLTHPNSVPMHLIFREAKERVGVTVLLSGEGADEVFGGYEWYSVGYRREALRRVPGLSFLSGLAPFGKLATLQKILRPEYLLSANSVNDVRWVRSVTAGNDPVGTRLGSWPRGREGVEGLFIYDQRTYLLPLLQRQDRMSMAAGLEARVPFLDHALVEWANGLPAGLKLAGARRKAFLKRLSSPWLPDDIIHREKVGFAMPLGEWLRTGALAHRVDRLRDSPHARSVVRAGELERLIGEHRRHERNHADIIWSLIALDIWAETFLGDAVHGVRLPGASTGRPIKVSQLTSLG